ncbi:hypothetical protein DCS_02121 [Drechmeria coniospora]|uniref:Uncharacterized protein n=1 Tax=Drechmeria coniospora TaxID=98403 RepID=A0A151GV83_DRECN|nr:hypothetical protein DCS_02121 [Drechmeria coniospora]KYK60981.1 hypothetical protein DCS_02121 [Drechmeria coniospora]
MSTTMSTTTSTTTAATTSATASTMSPAHRVEADHGVANRNGADDDAGVSVQRSSTNPIPQIQVMPPPKKSRQRREPRDTGFPEPFGEGMSGFGRHTTLPHPDADLSPNATISHDDIAVDRVLKRHRLAFLNKNRKTLNHGMISPQMEALQSVLSLTFMDKDGAATQLPKLVCPSTSSLRLSRDGGDSTRSKRFDDDETPPTSPDVSEHRRRKGLLGRLRRRS